MYSTRYSCHILMKLEFVDRLSRNPPISNFLKILPVKQLFQTDRNTRHDEANSRFSQLCERAHEYGWVQRLENPSTELKLTQQECIFIHSPVKILNKYSTTNMQPVSKINNAVPAILHVTHKITHTVLMLAVTQNYEIKILERR